MVVYGCSFGYAPGAGKRPAIIGTYRAETRRRRREDRGGYVATRAGAALHQPLLWGNGGNELAVLPALLVPAGAAGELGVRMSHEAKKGCPGSPRFLDWLAQHNRAQSSLEDSNQVMGWAGRPDARHGVDCACMEGPDTAVDGIQWFNNIFRREGIMPKKAKKLHYAAPGATRASCGKRMRPEDPRVGYNDFFAADANGTLCKNCFRAATNEASPF